MVEAADPGIKNVSNALTKTGPPAPRRDDRAAICTQ
jgi:hypothetical protein